MWHSSAKLKTNSWITGVPEPLLRRLDQPIKTRLLTSNQRASVTLKPYISEDDMELDAEVLLNLEQDQAMQEDVAAEGSITS